MAGGAPEPTWIGFGNRILRAIPMAYATPANLDA